MSDDEGGGGMDMEGADEPFEEEVEEVGEEQEEVAAPRSRGTFIFATTPTNPNGFICANRMRSTSTAPEGRWKCSGRSSTTRRPRARSAQQQST